MNASTIAQVASTLDTKTVNESTPTSRYTILDRQRPSLRHVLARWETLLALLLLAVFVIGGVSPVEHLSPPVTLVDRELQRFDDIWAAAGHPNGVFRLTVVQLLALTGAPLHDVVLQP